MDSVTSSLFETTASSPVDTTSLYSNKSTTDSDSLIHQFLDSPFRLHIAIGISVAVFALIFVIATLCCYTRRYRRYMKQKNRAIERNLLLTNTVDELTLNSNLMISPEQLIPNRLLRNFNSIMILSCQMFLKNQTLSNENYSRSVVVKTVQDSSDNLQRQNLENELKLLILLGPHKYITAVIGFESSPQAFSLVLENCREENLPDFLLNNADKYQPIDSDFQSNDITAFTFVISRARLVTYAKQVASGMKFLHQNKCVNGNLAACNIFLSEDLSTAKISGIGYSHQENCLSTSIRAWKAPEVLLGKGVSLPSDVWSFGVLLWEIFSLGQSPYAEQQADVDFPKILEEGYRLSRPDCADDSLSRLMFKCWAWQPEQRPSFKYIKQRLNRWMYARKSGLF